VPDDGQPLVLVCHDPTRYITGQGSYVMAHALAARRAGFTPHIFCAAERSEVVATEFGAIHRVGTRARHFLVAPVYQRPIATGIAAYLSSCAQSAPFVVHGFGTFAACAASAAAMLDRRGVEAVPLLSAYTAVGHEWRGLLRWLWSDRAAAPAAFYAAWYPWVRTVLAGAERWGYRRAELVLVNYECVARLLREAYGSGPEIRRIPYSPATAFDSSADGTGSAPPPLPVPVAELEPREAPLIISVSRHQPGKGVDVLLRALASLRAAGVAFRACLTGPGRLLAAHRRLASGLGLAGSVAIPGYVDDVVPYLRHADVFVLPSLEEGSGSVALLEALQVGTAVVASSCDGIPEDIADGRDGLLVPPGDVGSLCHALRSLLTDPARRATLALGARRTYERRFSPEVFSDALGGIYAELGVRA